MDTLETLSIVAEWLNKTDAIKPNYDISSIKNLVNTALENKNTTWDIRESYYDSEYYHNLLNQKYEPFSAQDINGKTLIYFRKLVNL